MTDLRKRISGLSLQPLINPWMKCNVTEASDDVLTDLLKNCTLSYDTDVPLSEEPILSDGERGDSDSFSCEDILSSSDKDDDDDGDDCQANQLLQEGAGASASPGNKGKKRLYSQETQLLHWPSSGHSSDGSMLPTLDSSDYNTSWFNSPLRLRSSGGLPLPLSSLGPSASNQPPALQGSIPSPPNNSFLSSSDMPTSQASDPNSMFLNPISTKAKYTNLLHHHRRRSPLSRLDSGSNSDQDEDDNRRLRPYENRLSSSDSHHSDEDTESVVIKTLLGATPSSASLYRLQSSRSQRVVNRPFSIGEGSASPDDDDDDDEGMNEGGMIETTGESKLCFWMKKLT